QAGLVGVGPGLLRRGGELGQAGGLAGVREGPAQILGAQALDAGTGIGAGRAGAEDRGQGAATALAGFARTGAQVQDANPAGLAGLVGDAGPGALALGNVDGVLGGQLGQYLGAGLRLGPEFGGLEHGAVLGPGRSGQGQAQGQAEQGRRGVWSGRHVGSSRWVMAGPGWPAGAAARQAGAGPSCGSYRSTGCSRPLTRNWPRWMNL